MHLLETYALSTASKIGKPFIVKKFFPVSFEKYITIQNSSGMPSKCYDYFQEVINFLLPTLSKHNIGIIQIGGGEDAKLNGAQHLNGITNINQTAHVLSNSLLHVGNDSFAVHMANAFDVPTVGLYSITLPEIAGPFFNKKNSICLYPDNQKPSFDPNEAPKRINKIKIEDVVNSCLKLLFKDDSQCSSFKTFYIGRRFKETIIESTADQVIDPQFFKGMVLNLRCDYVDEININILYSNLSVRSCCIVTDKPFNISQLLPVKNNLQLIIYDVTKDVDIDFIKSLHSLGIKYACAFNKNSDNFDLIEKRRFEVMDYCGIEEFSIIPEDAPKEIPSGLKFISNRILLSNGKVYTSRAAQLEDIYVDISNLTLDTDKIKDKQKFLEDIEYCYLYSE